MYRQMRREHGSCQAGVTHSSLKAFATTTEAKGDEAKHEHEQAGRFRHGDGDGAEGVEITDVPSQTAGERGEIDIVVELIGDRIKAGKDSVVPEDGAPVDDLP